MFGLDHPHFASKNESVTILGREAEYVSFLFILLKLIFLESEEQDTPVSVIHLRDFRAELSKIELF